MLILVFTRLDAVTIVNIGFIDVDVGMNSTLTKVVRLRWV